MSSIPIFTKANDGHARWRWRNLLRAPHRLAFSAAMAVLALTSVWWALTLSARLGWVAPWPVKVWPPLAHGTMMTFGFLPLFFMGFLNTAGPRWLGAREPRAHDILVPVGLQLAGWLVWIAGSLINSTLMLAGGVLALVGLAWAYQQFGQLVLHGQSKDQTHARVILVSGWLGIASLATVLVTWGFGEYSIARAAIFTGLWGFIAATFVTVSHRMIPFFTASAVPMVTVWRPNWILFFLLAGLFVNLVPVWTGALGFELTLVEVTISFWLLVSGLIVIWLAIAWGLLKALNNKLLVMLHIGFVWLGVSFLLVAVGHFWSWTTGAVDWSLGALHATTMGFIGSLTMAMITRVSSGHSGRLLKADSFMWSLFLALQVIVVLRVTADMSTSIWSLRLLTTVSIVWTVIFLIWGARLLVWYGKPRKDNQPG